MLAAELSEEDAAARPSLPWDELTASPAPAPGAADADVPPLPAVVPKLSPVDPVEDAVCAGAVSPVPAASGSGAVLGPAAGEAVGAVSFVSGAVVVPEVLPVAPVEDAVGAGKGSSVPETSPVAPVEEAVGVGIGSSVPEVPPVVPVGDAVGVGVGAV